LCRGRRDRAARDPEHLRGFLLRQPDDVASDENLALATRELVESVEEIDPDVGD
jgi:hypothetical protein